MISQLRLVRSLRTKPHWLSAHSVHDGKKSFLHSIVDSGAEKKTADYRFTILNEAIVEIKILFGKDVFAICTDNEAKRVKMRELALKDYTTVLT